MNDIVKGTDSSMRILVASVRHPAELVSLASQVRCPAKHICVGHNSHLVKVGRCCRAQIRLPYPPMWRSSC